jgi:putative hydrolase of the HAD superfamily
MHLRGLLFDYGGTLDGAASHWLDRFVLLYRAAGVERPFAEIKEAFYAADAEAYADRESAAASLLQMIDRHVASQLRHLRIDDSALRETVVTEFVAASRAALAESLAHLSRLSAHYRLGVVSNFYGNVAAILAEHGFDAILRVVADSNVVGYAKPDARIFAYALSGLGTSAGETMHIGDSYERDVEAAHRAGLRTAWLTTDGARGPADGRGVADLRVRDLAELVAALTADGAPA